jgi:hypothetical protein
VRVIRTLAYRRERGELGQGRSERRYWGRVKKAHALDIAKEVLGPRWARDHELDRKPVLAEALEAAFDPEASAASWSLTSLREKLIKIGAKVVRHGRYVTFQLAEVAVSRQMFADILALIARLRAPPAPA